jgi:hypothetical protein
MYIFRFGPTVLSRRLMTMAERATVDRWVAEYMRCWREKDADGVAELFTENALYRSSPFREPFVGRAAIRNYWGRATGTQVGIHVEAGVPVCDGNRASVEWWATWATDGVPTTLPGCLMLRFAPDARCEELREYWHSEKAVRAPPPGWGH